MSVVKNINNNYSHKFHTKLLEKVLTIPFFGYNIYAV